MKLFAMILAAVCTSLVVGCASTPVAQTVQLSVPEIPSSLLASCPDLTPLSDGSRASVLSKLADIASQYHDCASRQEALSKAVHAQRNP